MEGDGDGRQEIILVKKNVDTRYQSVYSKNIQICFPIFSVVFASFKYLKIKSRGGGAQYL